MSKEFFALLAVVLLAYVIIRALSWKKTSQILQLRTRICYLQLEYIIVKSMLYCGVVSDAKCCYYEPKTMTCSSLRTMTEPEQKEFEVYLNDCRKQIRKLRKKLARIRKIKNLGWS